MNIIEGDKNAELVKDRHTILELDRFKLGDDGIEDSAYCVITDIPLEELDDLVVNIERHADLIGAYRRQDWETCLVLIQDLTGKWDKQVDSFYEIMWQRCQRFLENPPGDNWSYVVVKYVLTPEE